MSALSLEALTKRASRRRGRREPLRQRLEFAKRVAHGVPRHAARPLHALAIERSAAERTRVVHGASPSGVEERTAALANHREGTSILRDDRVAAAETSDGVRDDRPLEIRHPRLPAGPLEVATIGAFVASEARAARIEVRIDPEEVAQEVLILAGAASHRAGQPHASAKRKSDASSVLVTPRTVAPCYAPARCT